MDSQTCLVAIVGAGPTGLTLANILGRLGVETIVVERNKTTVTEPRAVSIDDESLRTMQGIGLIEAVLADVALDYGSHYFTPDGRCFAKVEPSTREYGFPRRNAFAQPKLEATLREGLAHHASVTALFGHRCEHVDEHDDHVDLAIVDEDGASRSIRARYLVGCDGARSAIRKQIGSTLGGSTYDQRWLIVDLAATRERLRQTRVVCDPERPFLTLPGPAGIRRYEFMLKPQETDEAAEDPAFVRALLAANGPDADAPVVRRQVYAFHARIADRWNTRRIFLAGDAAHLSPPFAGQGMNSGLRDAQNLGWKLAAVLRGDIGEGLLDTYQRERAPHARALVQLAVNLGRVMMPSSRRQAWLVQAAFRATKLLPRVQAYFAQMKYKPKPFYRDGFALAENGLRANGRMLPQPRIELDSGRVVLLDDVLGDGFALIAYGADAQTIMASSSALDFGLPIAARVAIVPRDYNREPAVNDTIIAGRDVDDGLRGFAGGASALLIVRPDRYVAGASRADLDAMQHMAAQMRAMTANGATLGRDLTHHGT